jgi:hypothetical protein
VKHGSDLLLFLESRLLGDTQMAGFAGNVAVGVRGEPTLWWNASFGAQTPEHGIAARREGEPDVELFLEASEAVALLEGNANIDPLRVVGDRNLLSKFLNRYLNVRNTLDVRLGR